MKADRQEKIFTDTGFFHYHEYMNGKRVDFLVIVGLTFLDFVFGYFMQGTFWGKPTVVGILALLPAIIYLGLRKKKNWEKIAVATLVFGVLFGFLFEFRVEYTKTYVVPMALTLFPSWFGFFQPDILIGHAMMACFTIVFYEHFIERDRDHHISKNLIYAVLPGLCAAAVMILAFYFKPSLLSKGGYTYFHMGVVAIIPPILLGFFQPKFIRNMVETTIFFFFLWLAYELFSVKLGYWIYPGNNYVGRVFLFGISFPIEELLFWMLFYAASLVSYYELFVDVHSTQKIVKRKKR